jgi:hypothetical protein
MILAALIVAPHTPIIVAAFGALMVVIGDGLIDLGNYLDNAQNETATPSDAMRSRNSERVWHH